MRVRVNFAPPGWYATDFPLTLMVDGRPAYEGSFLQGAVHDVDVPSGKHFLHATVGSRGFVRMCEWAFEVPEEQTSEHALELTITYSRTWGRFNKEITSRLLPVEELAAFPAKVVAPEATITPDRKVIATWVVLATIIAGFAIELLFPVDGKFQFTPTTQTLIATGGLFPESVHDGEWYRVVTCAFLHGNFLHLGLNGVALVMAGFLLEARLGWRWFLSIYFVGMLGGSAVSLLTNDGHTVSIGASGAIMGLFASGMFVAHTLPIAQRGQVQFGLGRVLLPSLIPMVPRSGERIDIGAHLGGAIAGAVIGFVLLKLMRAHEKEPKGLEPLRSMIVPLLLAVALVVVSIGSFAGVAVSAYPRARDEIRLVELLLPNDDLPAGEPDDASIERWLSQYPQDPRVRQWAARSAFLKEDWDGALEHSRRARESAPRFGAVLSAASLAGMDRYFAELEETVALRKQLVPNHEWVAPDEATREVNLTAHLSDWAQRYPNDPRVQSEAAWRALEAGNIDEAARHVNIDYPLAQRFATLFGGELPEVHWLKLARAIVAHERHDEAVAGPLLQEICSGAEGADVQANAQQHHLCDPR